MFLCFANLSKEISYNGNNKNQLLSERVKAIEKLNNDINDSKSVADLSYQELVKQTKDWIKLHESNVVQTNYDEVNNVMKAKETYEDDLANKLLLLSRKNLFDLIFIFNFYSSRLLRINHKVRIFTKH